MLKKNLHPVLFKTKILYNNSLIFTLLTIKEKISIDIWSGNHPFYFKMLNKEIKKLEKNTLKFYTKYNHFNFH